MATSTVLTNKPINPRGDDNRPVDSYNRASLYSGKALDFDGVNDYVDISTFSMSGQDGSFCFYYQQDANSAFRYIFDMIPTTGVRVAIVIDDGQLKFLINNEALANQGEILNGEPNFCVITSEGTTQKFYINGQFIGSQTSATYISLATTGDAAIGSRRDGATAFLNGQIAGFKIFNTALTAAQVADLYNNPEKVVPTGVDNTALKLWLPMQEGAGTTAYDGSGNGNHGTISGATYTHGIGALVSQTAVIDWNKGSNIVVYSEKLDEWDEQVLTATQSTATAPDGSTNAYDLNDSNSGAYGILAQVSSVAMAGDYVGSLFIKKTTGALSHYPGFDIGQPGAYVIIDTTNGTTATAGTGGVYSDIAVTSYNDDWWRVSAKATINSTSRPMRIWPAISQNGTTLSVSATGINTFWGAQVEQADAIGPYIPTLSTAQTSPLLLPQGLTSGRDITGVNLFENVRKQGALNLDGKSWAEVHDNASLDFGTGSFTLEAWAKAKFVNQGSSLNTIMILGGNAATSSSSLNIISGLLPSFYYHTSSRPAASGSQNEGDWFHIVGVYDETNQTIYINGQQDGQSARTAINLTNTLVKEIGRDTTTARYYQDQIAQPRIYNRALTAEEVLNNYNATSSLYI